MNFKKLFDSYIKSGKFKELSSRSKQIYLYHGDKLGEYFADKLITQIKRSDMIRFLDEHSDRPAFANLTVRVASIVFSYAIDIDAMQFNPASRMKLLKVGSHVKWETSEVAQVISLGDRRISVAVALAWYTGQRESDVLAMKWGDYDGAYIDLVQRKTGLEMKIKVHPDLVAILDPLRGKPEEYIVSGEKQMSGPAFRNMLKRRVSKLNIDKVFHGIRKGVASSLAENGRSLNEIAAIMGHKSIRMAAYYSEQANNKILTDNAVGGLTSCV